MVDLEALEDPKEIASVKDLIARHVRYTQSAVGRRVLERWDRYRARFVKVMSTEYKRALAEMAAEAAQAAAVTGGSFRELLLADATVSEHLNEQEVERLLDPLAYTGLCSQIATEQAARARETAAELLAQD